jgi:peptide-methionine (S)-S-oxide reductase
MFFKRPADIPATSQALPGRDDAIPTAQTHFLNGRPLKADLPEGFETAMFGMGCFWGVEQKFWQLDGVWMTAVGYAAGPTPNPTYQEVCSGQTGHTEVVLVSYDPKIISYGDLLKVFWENHDPTQGMRQGNDRGTQYRSGVYTYSKEHFALVQESKAAFQARLTEKGFGVITTEIMQAPEFFYAEEYHQQYLAKNPSGYCGLSGTGVSCPIGLNA